MSCCPSSVQRQVGVWWSGEAGWVAALLKTGTQPPTPLAPGARSRAAAKPERDLATVFFADWFAPILMHPVMKVSHAPSLLPS